MARVPDLEPYAEEHGLKMITIADLIAYRRRYDQLVERVVATNLPTTFGDFDAVGYRSLVDDKHHVALVKGEVAGQPDVLVRVHSECLTGDVFHSLRCDCGEQLESALAMIERRGRGRAPVPLPGGARHRPAEQAARLQAAGGGARHRRRQRAARPAGRPARLRDRRADPRRPRAELDPHPHQQPEEDPRASRATGCRSPTRSRSSTRRTRTTTPTCAPSASAGPPAAPPGPRTSTTRCCTPSARSRRATTAAARSRRGAVLRGPRRAAERGARGSSSGGRGPTIEVFDVPGAFELPLAAQLRRRARAASAASPASAR